jgi:LPXTG-motif cell wall-anchored protein
MKQTAFLPLVLISSMGALLAPVAKADPVYQATKVTFAGPVEIPGMVLTPGTYVIKLLDPYGDRDIVRFYNADESHMYAMVFGVRDYRLDATENPVITFEERAKDAPPAIKEWFPAGENWGEQFVYKKVPVIAEAQPAPPPAPPVAIAAAPAPKPAPAPAPVAQVTPPPAPVQIAQAQPAPSRPPASTPPPAPEPKKELPKTASGLPFLASLGVLLVLAGAILRRRTA